MNLKLENRNALVCGSTQGIGRACAMALAEQGANVTLLARDEEKLQMVLKELPNTYQNHDYAVADFSDITALRETVEQKLKEKNIYHILLNNTGGPPAGPIFSAEIDEFERAFTQHLKANHTLVQILAPKMKEIDFGRIINIISTSVKQPLNGLGVSNTTRGAVANWSKTLANELGEFGITVNNVLPGATATTRLSEIIKDKATKTETTPEEISKKMKRGIPARRFAHPGEIANAVAFLASEAASYINGINLPVDGGRTKCL